MHGGQLVRGVLVLLLVLGHLPPAAGAAQLPRVVAVAGGVLLRVLVHGFEVGEALPEHGEGHVVVSGVSVTVGCSGNIILPRITFSGNALRRPGSVQERLQNP